MIIVEVESLRQSMSKCVQCERFGRGMRRQIYGQVGEDRGSVFLCFDCSGPQIIWKKSENGVSYSSPERRP